MHAYVLVKVCFLGERLTTILVVAFEWSFPSRQGPPIISEADPGAEARAEGRETAHRASRLSGATDVSQGLHGFAGIILKASRAERRQNAVEGQVGSRMLGHCVCSFRWSSK